MRTIFAPSRFFCQRAAATLLLAALLAMAGPASAQAPADPAPAVPSPASPGSAPTPVPAPPEANSPANPAPSPAPPPIVPRLPNNIPPGSIPGMLAPPPDNPDSAFEPVVTAEFQPASVRMGRPAEFRVIIIAAQRVGQLPQIVPTDGLTLQQLATSTASVVMNGETVIKSIVRYRATAEEPGPYAIPSFQIQIGKHLVQVPERRLTVLEPQPGEAATQPVRAVLDLPKRDFFVGETIQGRLLCIDSPDEEAQFLSHVAKSNGAMLFKPAPRATSRENFTWDGKPAHGMILPVEITPLVAGETQASCQVMVQVKRQAPFGGSFFAPLSTLDTPPVPIKVLPLPQAGRPPGFTGAIGKFVVGQPQLSANEVEVGEPLGIQLELRGKGNVDGVPAPEFPPQADWMAYRPTNNYEADSNGGGTKTYTFTLVPKRAGIKSTPPLPFAYFDPEARQFRDISIPPLPVTVKAGAAPAPAEAAKTDAAAVADAPTEVPAVLTGLAEKPGRWLKSPAPAMRSFLIAQLAPPCLLFALWSWRKRREYLAQNPGILRRRKAHAAARAALASARAAAQRNDVPGFLTAGLGALREAAAPLNSTQAGSLTREEVLRQLRDDQRAARAAESFFQSAEASRYASDLGTTANPGAMLPELEHAVDRLSALA